MEEQKIVAIYYQNVKGKKFDPSQNVNDGSYGHWLESLFGVRHNADNKPDLFGFEIKSETTSKITFGDWSADYYIYKDPSNYDIFTGSTIPVRKDQFLKIFTRPNPNNKDRYSWSGTSCPKLNSWTPQGQTLIINENQDIQIFYSYEKDTRTNKDSIIPYKFKLNNLLIAQWNKFSIQEKLERKFNQNGWITCKTNSQGEIDRLCIGNPINFQTWINWVKTKDVFFDSGMYEGNPRPYSQWRANNSLWNHLIVKTY